MHWVRSGVRSGVRLTECGRAVVLDQFDRVRANSSDAVSSDGWHMLDRRRTAGRQADCRQAVRQIVDCQAAARAPGQGGRATGQRRQVGRPKTCRRGGQKKKHSFS